MRARTALAALVSLWLLLLSCACGRQAVSTTAGTPPVSALADPRIVQALCDACAALEFETGIPLCSLAPPLPQRGRDFAAIVFVDGRAATTYDRETMARVADQYGYEAVVGVFGHELGHVIQAATGTAQRGPASIEEQIDADIWGGCALRILGHPVEPFQRLLRAELSADAAVGDMRAAAAAVGWNTCGAVAP